MDMLTIAGVAYAALFLVKMRIAAKGTYMFISTVKRMDPQRYADKWQFWGITSVIGMTALMTTIVGVLLMPLLPLLLLVERGMFFRDYNQETMDKAVRRGLGSV